MSLPQQNRHPVTDIAAPKSTHMWSPNAIKVDFK